MVKNPKNKKSRKSVSHHKATSDHLECTVITVNNKDNIKEKDSPSGKSVSWRKKYFHRKAATSSELEDQSLELYRELKVRLSSFQAYSSINGLLPVILRFGIFSLSAFLLRELLIKFYRKISSTVASEALQIKRKHLIVKFCIKFIVASYKTDRGLMLILLFALLPLLALAYCFLIGSCCSAYVFMTGADEVEREIWEKGRKKPFWVKRLFGYSSRLDCVLGYAFTLPLIHFLDSFSFKLIPVPERPWLSFLMPFLVTIDEYMTIKRKIELEAIFKLFRFHIFILFIGVSWIFLIRYDYTII